MGGPLTLGPPWLEVKGRLTYSVNGADVGEVVCYGEFQLSGTPTVHQVARRVGGGLRHSLPAESWAALCGAKPSGGFGSRGTWVAFRPGWFGVTCRKCQDREPPSVADLSLDEVLARCLSDER